MSMEKDHKIVTDKSSETQKSKGKKPIVFLATGGTGGHIIPMITIAKRLLKEETRPIIISDENFKKYLHLVDGIEYKIIPASPLYKHPKKIFKCIYNIIKGILKSYLLLSAYRPKLVMGFGGYASYPMLKAARMKNVSIALHEQNSYMGKVNKRMARHSVFTATSYPETYGVKYEAMQNIEFTGNPIREELKSLYDVKYSVPDINKGEKFNILIVGGSGGAKFMSKVIAESLLELPRTYKDKLFISQQCREEDLDLVRKKYSGAMMECECKTFFKDMLKRIQKAHLIICRAGASTTSEMLVAGRPMILIPYPHAINNHQMQNAKYVAQRKGGFILKETDFDKKEFLDLIKDFIDHPETLEFMSKNSRNASIVNADDKIIELIKKAI